MPIADFIETKRFAARRDLIAAGFQPETIARAVARGDLVRMDRGVYAAPDAADHWQAELAVVTCAFPRSVIALESAAQLHELCDVMPDAVSIMVPFGSKIRSAIGTPVRAVITRRPEALSEGIETLDVAGYPVPITSPARTVVDLHRVGSEQSSAMSIVVYMERGLDPMELDRLSQIFGIEHMIAPLTIALQLKGYGL
jgi:predicted transcriptional regulator of viral defense system